ncbi:unnamed protein product [Coregonus sp. 'balchen']|nr:unnamed protein product [Coregonus sp. 'balchen']
MSHKAYCGHCSERIWGLGTQGYKCINCKLLVHKRCHKLVPLTCQRHMDPVMPSQEPPLDEKSEEVDLPPEDTEDTDGITFLPHSRQVDKVEKDSKDIKAVVDGIDGIKISQEMALGLGDFDLIRVIGRGSYAKVLLVRLKKNEQIYAMKVVKKELVHDDEVRGREGGREGGKGEEEREGGGRRREREGGGGERGKGEEERERERLFLVIEYVNGGDLMFHMQRQRKLPEEHARFYAAEICIALNFLHEKGIIYRDLKLDNVLLDHEGHIKLTDYGMCKEGIRPGDTTSTFCGTPNYIGPEILRGEDYGFSVDWWALGVLMFEMMAGSSYAADTGRLDVILEKTIRIPRSLSVKAASVLKGFLNKLGTVTSSSTLCQLILWEDQNLCSSNQLQHRLLQTASQPASQPASLHYIRDIKREKGGEDWEREGREREVKERETWIDRERREEGKRAGGVERKRGGIITDDYGLENFDTQFTNEPVQLTPDDEDVIRRIDQSEFEGFEYINPLLLSTEESV